MSKAESPLSQAWYKAKQRNISSNQKKVLRDHWVDYGVDLKYGEVLDIQALFDSENWKPVILDIGFGMGESIVHMASNDPERGYLGVEIHRAGVAQCLGEIVRNKLSNVRLIRADVTMLLENHIPRGCLDEIHVYFPDPWPNQYRDGKRRIIRPKMISMFKEVLRPGGTLRIATDVADYAAHVEVTMASALHRGSSASAQWVLVEKEVYRPLEESVLRVRGVTKYEKRALELQPTEHIFEYLYRVEKD